MAIASRAAPTAVKPVTAAKAPGSSLFGNSGKEVKLREATMTVTTTMLENGTAKGEPIVKQDKEVKVFLTSPANVGVGVSYTRNLGNMESCKINVMLNMPCYNEEVDEAFAQVVDKAKFMLETALGELSIEQPGEADLQPLEPAAEATGEPVAEVADDGTVTVDYLIAATREQMLEVCGQLEGDQAVNADDYTEDDDLRQVLIQTIFGEEALQAAIAGQEAAGEGAEAVAETTGYTEEELQGATPEDLKKVYTEWNLGPYPKGPANVAKKVAIKKILEAQGG